MKLITMMKMMIVKGTKRVKLITMMVKMIVTGKRRERR